MTSSALKKTGRFAAKWLLIFFVVSVLAFLIPRLIPDDPVKTLLDSHQMPVTEENVARIRAAWGLDRPLTEQYGTWITRFIQGDWGSSLVTKQDIRGEFMDKLPYSLTIGLGGMLLSIPAAFFLGYGAAVRPRGFCDRFTRLLSLLSVSIPSFVLSVLVIYWLGVKLRAVRFFTGDSLWGLAIAVLLMVLYSAGPAARIVKSHFLKEKTELYVTVTVSFGFSERYALLHGASRQVLYGLLSVLIARFAWMLGGSSILEFAFGIPGISWFLVESMRLPDYYVLQSYLMVVVLWMFAVHLVFAVVMNRLDRRAVK